MNLLEKTWGRRFDRERLNQLLAERVWTIYTLAMKAGLSECVARNQTRRNQVPSPWTAGLYAKALGVSLDEIAPKIR